MTKEELETENAQLQAENDRMRKSLRSIKEATLAQIAALDAAYAKAALENNEEMETDLYADEDVEENVEDEIRAVLAEEESDLIALSKKYVERQIESALEDHEEHYRRQAHRVNGHADSRKTEERQTHRKRNTHCNPDCKTQFQEVTQEQ